MCCMCCTCCVRGCVAGAFLVGAERAEPRVLLLAEAGSTSKGQCRGYGDNAEDTEHSTAAVNNSNILSPTGLHPPDLILTRSEQGGSHGPQHESNEQSKLPNEHTPSPPTKSFPIKSPWVKLSGRLPIKFNGHENSHPLEWRVCLSQTHWNPNS